MLRTSMPSSRAVGTVGDDDPHDKSVRANATTTAAVFLDILPPVLLLDIVDDSISERHFRFAVAPDGLRAERQRAIRLSEELTHPSLGHPLRHGCGLVGLARGLG